MNYLNYFFFLFYRNSMFCSLLGSVCNRTLPVYFEGDIAFLGLMNSVKNHFKSWHTKVPLGYSWAFSRVHMMEDACTKTGQSPVVSPQHNVKLSRYNAIHVASSSVHEETLLNVLGIMTKFGTRLGCRVLCHILRMPRQWNEMQSRSQFFQLEQIFHQRVDVFIHRIITINRTLN